MSNNEAQELIPEWNDYVVGSDGRTELDITAEKENLAISACRGKLQFVSNSILDILAQMYYDECITYGEYYRLYRDVNNKMHQLSVECTVPSKRTQQSNPYELVTQEVVIPYIPIRLGYIYFG